MTTTRAQVLFERFPSPIIWWTHSEEEGGYWWCSFINRAAREVFQYNPQGLRLNEAFPAFVQAGKVALFDKVLATGKPLSVGEHLGTGEQHHEQLFALDILPIGENGILVLFEEVTQAVWRGRLFDLMTAHHPIIPFVIGTHPPFEAKFINPAVSRVLGWTPEDFYKGANFWVDRIHPQDVEPATNGLLSFLKETTGGGDEEREEAPYILKYRLLNTAGEYRWFRSVMVLVAPEGRIFGFLEDIHDRKARELALGRAVDTLGKVSGALSHDLRTPVRHMSVFANMVERRLGRLGVEDEQIAKWLGLIQTTANKTLSMAEGLLDLARPHPEHPPTEIHLRALILDLITRTRGVNVNIAAPRLEIEVPTDLVLVGHLGQLEALLVNLLTNAIKFAMLGADDPMVQIKAEGPYWDHHLSAEVVSITFTDNGIGFEPSQADDLFAFKVKLSPESAPGHGIGLAIVKQICEAHGGHVHAHSNGPGTGASFRVTLPWVDPLSSS